MIYTVIYDQKYIITTYAPASILIVSLNTKKKKVSVSNAKKKFWTKTMKDTLPDVKILVVKKKSKEKEKKSIYKHRKRFKA